MEYRPSFSGADQFVFSMVKIPKGKAGEGKYRLSIRKVEKGSKEWTAVKFRRFRIATLKFIVEQALVALKSDNESYPKEFFLEDRGQKRGGGEFSYGEFRIVLKSAGEAEIRLDPKSDKPEEYKPMVLTLVPATYGKGNGEKEVIAKSMIPTITDLVKFLETEYKFGEGEIEAGSYDGGNGGGNSSPGPSGDEKFEDDIPF